MHVFMQLPVDGDIVLSFVDNVDHKRVSVVHFQRGSWILPVHRDGAKGIAQPLHWCCLNLFQ